MTERPRPRWWLAAASLLIPGAGQLLAGRLCRWIAIALAEIVIVIALQELSVRFGSLRSALIIGVAGFLAVRVASAIDASRLPLKMQDVGRIWLSSRLLAWVVLYGSVVEHVFPFFAHSTHAIGLSMAPTARDGDRLLLHASAYRLRIPFLPDHAIPLSSIGRGEIVSAWHPIEPVKIFKRVIGIPGDRVEIRAGRSIINGHPVDEPYADVTTRREAIESTQDFGPVLVPDECYFVLGDARRASEDSRVFGCVREEDVLGRIYIWNLSD